MGEGRAVGEGRDRHRDEYDEHTRCEKRVTVWPSVLYFMCACACVCVELFRKNSDLNSHLNSQSSIFVCLFMFFYSHSVSLALSIFFFIRVEEDIVSIFMLGCFRSME